MMHEFEDSGPWLEMAGNNPLITFFASDAASETDCLVIEALIEDYKTGEREVCLQMSAPLSSLLDYAIDGNELTSNKPNIDIDAKPLFMRTREELLKLVAKIDSLSFA